MATGIELIARERQRQITEEGWTSEHDNTHRNGELVLAAMTYADEAHIGSVRLIGSTWPWDEKWWKPGSPVRNLVKAGALIAAEIDRLQRLQGIDTKPTVNVRSCNRHSNCDEANAEYKAKHGDAPPASFHCHDDECPDCFGC